MFSYICALFPSVISILLEKKLLNKKCDINMFLDYIIYCLLNNLISISIFTFIYNNNYDIWSSINLYPRMTIKYCAFSIVTALILGFIKIIIAKNVGFRIEVKNK